jgi:hypothetical protein
VRTLPLRRAHADALLTVGLSAALVAIAFLTSSDADQTAATAGNTWTEIVLTLLGAAAVGAAALGAGLTRGRAWGAATVGLMAALTGLTALSLIWSVVPDTSWSTANEMLGYLGAFAGGAALARLAPGRWPVLLGALALATVALSAWALLAKVFPATLAANDTSGRLQAPFGYYNPVGIVGALALPACLWAGARRDRGRQLAGLAAPAVALALTAVVLAESRSADAAAVAVLAAWVAFVPLRLRSAVVLAVGGAGAAAICAWALTHSALTANGTLTPAMDSAGHTWGIVVAIVLVLVAVAGMASARAMDNRAVSARTRRRAGSLLIVLACLVPVAALGAVATSSRGLTGEISHVWSTLTSTRGGAANVPGRVLELGSSRPLYWREGLTVGEHALLKGAGASGYGTARLRYTTNPAKSDQAHSYVIETFADLGLIGVAISLALLIAWIAAAARPLAPRMSWRASAAPERDERQGMVVLALIVVGFGIESTLDWTWYFPGVAVPVLVCAGWLAGRGPLSAPVGRQGARRSLLDRPGAVAVTFMVAAVALGGAWVQWQPLRSADDVAVAETASTNAQAFAAARAAVDTDPLSLTPRFLLAELYRGARELRAARSVLLAATRVQPENPLSWAQLGSFDLTIGYPRRALTEMTRVLALDRPPDPTHQTALSVSAQAEKIIAGELTSAGRRSATKRSAGRSRAAARS